MAWGGASGKRDFITHNFPTVPILQPVTERHFARLIHGIGQHARQMAIHEGIMTPRITNFLVRLDNGEQI